MQKRDSTQDILDRIGKISFREDGKPEFWPKLEPGDIGDSRENHPDGTPCCMLGWLFFVSHGKLPSKDSQVQREFEFRAYEVLLNIFIDIGYQNIQLHLLNDGSTPEIRAKVWNLAGERLGYWQQKINH